MILKLFQLKHTLSRHAHGNAYYNVTNFTLPIFSTSFYGRDICVCEYSNAFLLKV